MFKTSKETSKRTAVRINLRCRVLLSSPEGLDVITPSLFDRLLILHLSTWRVCVDDSRLQRVNHTLPLLEASSRGKQGSIRAHRVLPK